MDLILLKGNSSRATLRGMKRQDGAEVSGADLTFTLRRRGVQIFSSPMTPGDTAGDYKIDIPTDVSALLSHNTRLEGSITGGQGSASLHIELTVTVKLRN